MREIAAIIVAFAVTSLLCPCAIGEGLALDAEEIDFGKVKSTDTPQRTVRVTNSGNLPIKIVRVNSSCGCTRATVEAKTLKSGESANIEIRLKLSDYPTNQVHSRVSIDTDGEDSYKPQILVRGQVLPEYAVDPKSADFGRMKRNSQGEVRLQLKHQYGSHQNILQIEKPENLEIEHKPIIDASSAGTSGYAFSIRIAPGQSAGPFNSRFAIITDSERSPRIEIPVHAELVGVECSIQPKVLVFGPADPGSNLGDLTIEGIASLRVLQATTADGDLSAYTETLIPDKKYKVTLRAKPTTPLGRKAGKLLIEVQEGDLTETREVAYFGTIGNP